MTARRNALHFVAHTNFVIYYIIENGFHIAGLSKATIMAGGNKKKKKPAVNPARGFATTSIASKKPERIEGDSNADSTEPSGISTPAKKTDDIDDGVKPTVTRENTERELHELSPEELEAQLETSELQQFIERNAAKVRKEASRQVSRLETDKRLLRSQADFLSVKDWLPEELMQQILDFAEVDRESDPSGTVQAVMPAGDDLLAKVWQLRLCLLDLDVPLPRANDAVAHVLSRPPAEGSTVMCWGLADAFDWLALHCEAAELDDYDYQKPKASILHLDNGDEDIDLATKPPARRVELAVDNARSIAPQTAEDDLQVSDVASDLEPDEILDVYLRTKAKLFELNPDSDSTLAGSKKAPKGRNAVSMATTQSSIGERKLQQKLRKIEADVLFDQRQADDQWAAKKVELVRDTAERRKLQLQDKAQSSNGVKSNGTASPADTNDRGNVNAEAERMGQDLLKESEELDGDNMLSGMFSDLPESGIASHTNGTNGEGVVHSEHVTVRNFGRLTGMNPRRVLEEACKARDARCKLVYQLVSPTTYASRHSLTIQWTKEQAAPAGDWLHSVEIDQKPGKITLTMMTVATPDTAQSEAYIATATLFLIFSGSPKEEKSHLRLPPAYRDLWDEFTRAKRDHIDALDRDTVKELRSLIDQHATVVEEHEDEVVFNPNTRRLNGATSGTSTPGSRHERQRPTSTPSQELQNMWRQKTASPSYQRMLIARMTLPMYQFRSAALDSIQKHQVLILCGETGCGKSTQLPAFILEHELSQGRQCKVYCTEPRRISAISLAQRVSEEMGERKGDLGTNRSLVGYAIRLESHTAAQTRLVYATVGIVLRMLENADGLSEVTHLVIDEVHERSIDTDFLLIVLRSLMLRRPDLKVILMSATVDAQKFSNYLDGASIITVPGRTFPVQAKFLEDAIELTGHTNEDASVSSAGADDDSHDGETEAKSTSTQPLTGYSKRTMRTLAAYDEYRIDYSLIVKLIEKIAYAIEYQRFSKAILVFMPGLAEIRQLNDMLGGHPAFLQGWRIHPLHSAFSNEDQQAAFEVPTNGVRKIVIATNIAETGITIPDVTCVIDTGKHKEMRWNEKTQVSKLIQSFIARANAKQRRGRAGRVQEGICFHLFTKHRHDDLIAEQQTPEMLRLSLQDLVMRVKICRLGDIEHALSQALDPPSARNIRRAIDALIEVDALTDKEELTPLGQQLAKLPLDAQLGKLILFGSIFGCLDFALTAAAALSSKSPFVSPLHAKKQADSVRLGFKKGDSDLLTVYNAYCSWRKICNTSGLSEYQFCNKNFLSPQNLANIEDLKAQLLSSLVDAGFVALNTQERQDLSKARQSSRQRNFVSLPATSVQSNDDEKVVTSVVAWSFYPKVVKRDGNGWRNVANNQTLGLHPTSVNKHVLSGDIKYLSFYSIMQSASRFTNAQETTPVSDFAILLLAGDAVFQMYAGVIVIDGNRLRFKVRDWRTMTVLKVLRSKLKELLARSLKSPGKLLGDKHKRWMEMFEAIFKQRLQA